MEALDAQVIGVRARTIRRHRGLSLDVTAGLAGISKPYLAALERGQRGFTRHGLIEDLAGALGCSVADLTGQPYLPPDRGSADALGTLPKISVVLSDTTLDDISDTPVRPVEQLGQLVDRASGYCDQANYALSGRELAAVLTELQVHVVTGNTETRRRALATLVEACGVAMSTAKDIGRSTIALLAGRRGYDAAQRLGDPALIGFATFFRAHALMKYGARDRVTQLLRDSIDMLAGKADPTAPDPSVAEACGMLHLCAALNAAHAHRTADAHDHLSAAKTLADRTGERNTLRLHFGPTNVAVWSVAVEVELEDGPAAYDRITAHPIDVEALGSASRAATLHLDLARSLAQAEGTRDAEATRHLNRAERIAPVLIRNDPLARSVLADLHRRARRQVWKLGKLGNRFGFGATRPPLT